MWAAKELLLPAKRHQWVDALIAELSAIETAGARFRFAISGAFALLRDAAVRRSDLWMAEVSKACRNYQPRV